MPDLNSLPPSRSPSGTQLRSNGNPTESLPGQLGSHSPRASSVSLAAAATINAGIHQESRRSSTSSNRNRPSQSASRRRSNVAMNLSLNDPTLPSPGELQSSEHASSQAFRTSSPRSPRIQYSPPWPQHHHRTPSLGELHQELEQESEAQVNRLLEAIRQQQITLQNAQQNAIYTPSTSTAAVDDSTPTSERSFSFPSVPGTSLPMSIHNPRPRSPIPRGSTSTELSRQSSHRSRTPSRNTSPMLRPMSAGIQAQNDDWILANSGLSRRDSQSSRDESAYYQAETQTLTRENQMLRMRIRELERQLNEGNSPSTHSPATPSNLVPVDGDGTAQGFPAGRSDEREVKD